MPLCAILQLSAGQLKYCTNPMINGSVMSDNSVDMEIIAEAAWVSCW